MKILVLGAGGFIGSHMVKNLKREGHWVRGVDLKHPEFNKTEADDFIIYDLADQSQIEDKLEATQRKLKVLNEFVLDIKNLQTFDQIERAKFKKTTDQLASDAKRLNRNRILRFQQRKGELKKLF